MGQYSHSERDGHLLVVTINRPEVYNACHPMANEELSAEFDRFAADPDLWVAIVTAVVPHTNLMEEARRWAGLILECSPASVRATKQAVMRSLDAPSLRAAMDNISYPAYAAMAKGEDAIESPKAFSQKRKPVWKGR